MDVLRSSTCHPTRINPLQVALRQRSDEIVVSGHPKNMPILKCQRLYNSLEMFGANGYMTWHDFFEASARGKAERLAHGHGHAAGARIEVDRILGKLSIPRKEKMKVGTENRSKIDNLTGTENYRFLEGHVARSKVPSTRRPNQIASCFPSLILQDSPVICNKFVV